MSVTKHNQRTHIANARANINTEMHLQLKIYMITNCLKMILKWNNELVDNSIDGKYKRPGEQQPIIIIITITNACKLICLTKLLSQIAATTLSSDIERQIQQKCLCSAPSCILTKFRVNRAQCNR